MVTVISRAKRILRYMDRFAFFSESVEVPDGLPSSSGSPVGIYFNAESSLDGAIVVTDSSLVLNERSDWVLIPYRSIDKVVIPTFSVLPGEVRHLILNLSSGSSFTLPVKGGTDRTADAYEFARFLARVRSDLLSQLSP
jgi:hypothetical protein